MSELIVISIDDLQIMLNKAAKAAAKEGAMEAIKIMEEKESNDVISESEALEILKCSKSKLANLRAAREVTFYTSTRPYSYSKESVASYFNKSNVAA